MRELIKRKLASRSGRSLPLKSKWVYAEALRADDQDKLLNVHTPDVRPSSIPVPFNAGHIARIEDRTAIYEALTRLGVYPSGFAPIDRVARAFELIEKSDDIEDFEAFVADFAGEGKQFYIRLAKKKIGELSARRSGGAIIGAAVITEKGDTLEAAAATVRGSAATEGRRCVPAHRSGDAYRADQPHRCGCGLHAHGDRLAGQDGTALGAAGKVDREARTCCAPCACPSAKAMMARSMPWHCRRMANGWRRAAGTRATRYKSMSVYIFRQLRPASSSASAASQYPLILPSRPMATAWPPRSPAGKACGFGRREKLAASRRRQGLWRQNSYGAAFDGVNRVYTIAYDGQIRRYGRMGVLKREQLQKAARSSTASPCIRMAKSSPSASSSRGG